MSFVDTGPDVVLSEAKDLIAVSIGHSCRIAMRSFALLRMTGMVARS